MGGQAASSSPLCERDEGLRAYVAKLLEHPQFSSSTRRGKLFCYLIERTIAGKADELTEYAIGVDVFGKPPSFDTRIDSGVRAEMSRLRRALSAYYADSGGRMLGGSSFPREAIFRRLLQVLGRVRKRELRIHAGCCPCAR